MNTSSNFSHGLADDIPLPVFIFRNADLDLIWLNQAGQEWLGRSANVLEAPAFREAVQNHDIIKQAAVRCLNSQGPVRLHSFVLKRKNRAGERCQLTLFPTQEQLGLSIVFDMHSPNESQGQEFAAAAMGRMLAHEIKNPLAGIKGAAQLLKDDLTSEEDIKLVDLIGSEIDRIHRLADRMETLGDRDPSNEGSVNIHEILRDARKLFQSSMSSNIVFTEQYDPSLPEIMGDADTLMQAIVNLIKNAKEAIENNNENGEIKLETAFRSGVMRRGAAGETRQSLPIEIRVIDDGPGVSTHIREQIFQPFITNKPSGQGLGLALVAKVAAAHNGIIEVNSRPGRTVFSLLLPVNHS